MVSFFWQKTDFIPRTVEISQKASKMWKYCEKYLAKSGNFDFFCYDITNVLWRYSPEKKVDITNVLWRGRIKVLGVIFDRKLTFENHIWTLYNGFLFPQKLVSYINGSECLVMKILCLKYFQSFLLPCLEYCSPLWSLAADSHLQSSFLLSNFSVNLWHGCRISSLCLLHKIYHSNKHPQSASSPGLAIFACNTKQAAAANSIPFLLLGLILHSFPEVSFWLWLRSGKACL